MLRINPRNTTFKMPELAEILRNLESSRNKARYEGRYAESIREHEKVVFDLGRLLENCDAYVQGKVENIQSRIASETQAMQDYASELGSLEDMPVKPNPSKRRNDRNVEDRDRDRDRDEDRDGGNDHGAGYLYEDPDVWKPPTSDPYSRPRESPIRGGMQPRSQAIVQSRKAVTPSVHRFAGNNNNNNANNNANAGNSPAAARLERMRQERDNANGNRNNRAPTKAPTKAPLPSRAVARNGNAQQQPPKSSAGRGAQGQGQGQGKKDNSAAGGGAGDGPKKYSDMAKEKGLVDQDLIDTIENDIVEGKVSVTWESIAGLSEAKHLLHEAVVLPLWMPDYFTGIRRPWKGVMMFGPPGTGKTMLAKAVAAECGTTFFNVSAATIASKWHGQSEKMVRILFQMARYYSPSTIFFDEIDALAGSRGAANEHESSRRVKTELLVQMDGIGGDDDAAAEDDNTNAEDGEAKEDKPKTTVIVLAATNMPWDIDEAMRRRLEKRIYIPLPDTVGRKELFRINMKGCDIDENVDMEKLGDMCDGYSGADVANVCRDAAMMSVRRIMEAARKQGLRKEEMQLMLKEQKTQLHTAVSQQDFEDALAKVNASVSDADLRRYSEWMAEYGSA